MSMKRKIGRLGTLLVAASMIALSVGAAHAQQANDLADLNQRILENPQDVQLNLQYARAAEAAGQPRLALVAYERILINDPSNEEARRGYERIRRQIEPGYTVTRLEVGARYDSNAVSTNEDAFSLIADEFEAMTYYAKLMVANESQFLGGRWRSVLNLDVEETPEIDALDYYYLGAQTGPIFAVAPHVAVLPSVGGGVSWLGGDQYYSEVNLGLLVEGRMTGASYWVRLRGGYREYEEDTDFFFDTVTEEGTYVELRAGLTKPRLISERDVLLVAPFVRHSDIEGSIFNFWIFDDLAPGMYVEYGVDVNYNYQLTDHIEASVGVLVRERDFTDSIREDTYISPQASLTFSGMLPCNCDIRLQYRNRDNDTNDFSADYNADQVSLALLTRF